MSQVLRVGGVLVGGASCLPMVAMLPGGVGAVLAALGVHTTSGPFSVFADLLAPVAQPLLIAAVVALVVGSLRCGLSTVLLAAIGGTLLYLSMYVLPAGPVTRLGPAMSGMPAGAGDGFRADERRLVLPRRRHPRRHVRLVGAAPSCSLVPPSVGRPPGRGRRRLTVQPLRGNRARGPLRLGARCLHILYVRRRKSNNRCRFW